VANLSIANDGPNVGVWAQSSNRSSASIQANRTSASLMLYPNEGRSPFKHPFTISAEHRRGQTAVALG
jgi:hypothetical protein